jgi:hypothetical protein
MLGMVENQARLDISKGLVFNCRGLTGIGWT